MGTASTMATMAEALGLTLPGLSAIPAADSRKKMNAHLTGMRIVEMVKEDLTMSKILTREAFENAIILNAGVGGSTNFVLHLLAIAGRIGINLNLDDFDKVGSRMPFLLCDGQWPGDSTRHLGRRRSVRQCAQEIGRASCRERV